MGVRVSFTLVLTVLTLTLSLVPAVIIWVVFMDLMTASVDLLRRTTQNSTDSMALDLQARMIAQATERLTARVRRVSRNCRSWPSGVLDFELRPSRFDMPSRFLAPLRNFNFELMQGHQYFTTLSFNGIYWPNGTFGSTVLAHRTVALLWAAMYVDMLTGAVGQRTLYNTNMVLQPNERLTVATLAYCDQNTGKVLRPLWQPTFPASYFDYYPTANGWDTDLGFNQYQGAVQMGVWQWLPAQNDTWVQVSISIDAQTVSAELDAQLAGFPADRLVIFFRQPHGHMLAASHGKFYSHSDVDTRYVNVLTHPPNVSAYRLWTCLQSNDTLIPVACQQLYAKYQSWTAIPALRTEMVLNGERYWVSVNHTTTRLKATVLMLKNRAEVMGHIDATSAQVDDQMAAKKRVTFVILGVVTTIAMVLPLAVGLWLAARLMKLAAGMDQIAQLQFGVEHVPPTVFAELHHFQSSFAMMERGLQAFQKFVPEAVVHVLIAGQMQASNHMSPEHLTILFADIEGFSTVCENESPATLVAVCTEYFEAMCSNVGESHGTIDKFIGDCIMAIWNAPIRRPGHELDAVGAALAMQTSVMHLHESWRQRGLPVLRFRLGIHTGVCLVGNFGCSYRLSYTCLGDAVNLAARLEALNKKFGTNILVSQSTYAACRKNFHFRELAKVTVPGGAEVLPVYEVLCPTTEGSSFNASSPSAFLLPAREDSMDMVNLNGADSPSARGPRPKEAPAAPHAAAESPGEDRDPDGVLFHWQYVSYSALLAYTAQYEAAYAAMVAGNLLQARKVLSSPPSGIPDKAWQVLTDQLQRMNAAKPWDGVFYFTEK